MDDERREIEKLVEDIRELSDPLDEPQIEVRRGRFRYEISGFAQDIERDADGFISRIVGPQETHTIIRDEMRRVVRLETEREKLEFE
ncbi:MAG: hypothetical protein ACRDH7_09250 [Actinomycetota bacterium]